MNERRDGPSSRQPPYPTSRTFFGPRKHWPGPRAVGFGLGGGVSSTVPRNGNPAQGCSPPALPQGGSPEPAKESPVWDPTLAIHLLAYDLPPRPLTWSMAPCLPGPLSGATSRLPPSLPNLPRCSMELHKTRTQALPLRAPQLPVAPCCFRANPNPSPPYDPAPLHSQTSFASSFPCSS